LIGFFEGENAKLKVAVLELIRVLISAEDRGVKTRAVECLNRNELVPALCELEVSCEEVIESFSCSVFDQSQKADETDDASVKESKEAIIKLVQEFRSNFSDVFSFPRKRTTSVTDESEAPAEFEVKAKPQQQPLQLFQSIDAA
jgi:hypothetical protein